MQLLSQPVEIPVTGDFLTRDLKPESALNPAHGEVGGSTMPDILFPLFAAGMVGGLLFLAFGR